LIMTGVVFTGAVDTDIMFDYGFLSSACRRTDLAEFKRLDMPIDLRMGHLKGDRLFADWDEAQNRLRAVAGQIWGRQTPPSADRRMQPMRYDAQRDSTGVSKTIAASDIFIALAALPDWDGALSETRQGGDGDQIIDSHRTAQARRFAE